MQKRQKSLIRWTALICFLLATVGALTIRHFTMITTGSIHATHSIVSRTENTSPAITFDWKDYTPITLEKVLTTQVGLHTSHVLHNSASNLGKNLKHVVTVSQVQFVHGSSMQPVDTLPAPDSHGKMILISISNQWMYIYQDGQQLANTAITTGRPGLDTPLGIFHVFNKESPTTFYSMWPAGSANYFEPTHINFALEFLSPGYFIHDALWRHDYGPGSNTPHMVPAYGTESGSHGCVNVPYSLMPWLYSWADINTPVEISN